MDEYNEIKNLNTRKVKPRELVERANNFLSSGSKPSKNENNLSIYSSFSDEKYFYLNPTESLNMKEIVKPGDKFLSILASGDFALDAIYNGSKEVLTFDINGVQFFIANLKLFGLQSLGYDDFFNYFSNPDSRDWLSKNIYDEIKRNIPRSQIYSFLNVVMKEFDRYNSNFKNDFLHNLMGYMSSILSNKVYGAKGFKREGNYLENSDSYEETRKLVKDSNINFVKSDLVRLKNVLLSNKNCKDFINGGIDSAYLSNVGEYIDGQLFAKAIDDLMPLLNDDGVISYCCQGVSFRTLNNNSLGGKLGEVKGLKKFVQENSKYSDESIVNRIQQYNDVTAFSILKEKYDISCNSVDSLNSINGLEKKDTFVYVRKK